MQSEPTKWGMGAGPSPSWKVPDKARVVMRRHKATYIHMCAKKLDKVQPVQTTCGAVNRVANQ